MTFHLTPYELEVWNRARGQWVVENGDYTVTVGGSSIGGPSTQIFNSPPHCTPAQTARSCWPPGDATLHGSQIRVTGGDGPRALIGYWDDAAEYPQWMARVPCRRRV